MKYRSDFVTNSSSSSFICTICNRTESGMDMGLNDAEMIECENGHTVCEEHLSPKYKDRLENPSDEDAENEEDLRYEVKAKNCPVCAFEAIDKADAYAYLMKTGNRTEKNLLAELKEKFKTYDGFKNFLPKEKE